ncbi:hypothetical protein HK098_003818 [Nowakowskiella sp. JEL0407]|nr:hypothetical protein HK098_003818 [Nowakowskiella sp. JEL0407]
MSDTTPNTTNSQTTTAVSALQIEPSVRNDSVDAQTSSISALQLEPSIRKDVFEEDNKQFTLLIRQQPKQAKCAGVSDRVDRKPLDPLPILQLIVEDPATNTRSKNFLVNPFYFVYATLIHHTTFEEINVLKDSNTRAMAGCIASSLQRLKDVDSAHGAFFVFPDISIRLEGKFRLRFTLFEIVENEVVRRNSINSDIFTVFSSKAFPGMLETTQLSRFFAEQGLKIRLKKDSNRRTKSKAFDDLDDDDNESDQKRRRSGSEAEELARNTLPSSRPSQFEEEESRRNYQSNGMQDYPPQWNASLLPGSQPYYQQPYQSPASHNQPMRPHYPEYYDFNGMGNRPMPHPQDPRYNYPPVNAPGYNGNYGPYNSPNQSGFVQSPYSYPNYSPGPLYYPSTQPPPMMPMMRGNRDYMNREFSAGLDPSSNTPPMKHPIQNGSVYNGEQPNGQPNSVGNLGSGINEPNMSYSNRPSFSGYQTPFNPNASPTAPDRPVTYPSRPPIVPPNVNTHGNGPPMMQQYQNYSNSMYDPRSAYPGTLSPGHHSAQAHLYHSQTSAPPSQRPIGF